MFSACSYLAECYITWFQIFNFSLRIEKMKWRSHLEIMKINLKTSNFKLIIEFITWQKWCLSFFIQLNLTSFKTTGFLTENIWHAMKKYFLGEENHQLWISKNWTMNRTILQPSLIIREIFFVPLQSVSTKKQPFDYSNDNFTNHTFVQWWSFFTRAFLNFIYYCVFYFNFNKVTTIIKLT